MIAATSRIALIGALTAGLAGMAAAGAASKQSKTATTQAGQTVLVYGHKNIDRGCKPLPAPTIRVVAPPKAGAVSLSEGSFLMDGEWHPDSDRNCRGQTLPGLGVYYTPQPGFKGVDSFVYVVTLGMNRRFEYEVTATVTVY